MKNGERVVRKGVLREHHPFSKEFIADITRSNPQLLTFYKTLKGAQGAISAHGFDPDFNERLLAVELRERLASIAPGRTSATAYHHCVTGILTFLLYPHLVSPKIEHDINQGRKRIDLLFTNWATSGFFSTLKTAPQTRARYVIVECKNYSDDLGNPEFDQLVGRFSPMRGTFGIVVCRNNSNQASALARCRDAAQAGHGVVIVLEDGDLGDMLRCIENIDQSGMHAILERKYRQVCS